jgi:hypothetical protein
MRRKSHLRCGALASGVVCALAGAASAQVPVCAPGTLAPANGCISSEYDRFENKETVAVQMRVIGEEKGERVYLAMMGQHADLKSKPADIVVTINALSPYDFMFSGDCTLNVIADQQRFRVDTRKLSQEQLATYSYGQSFAGRFEFSDFAAIVRADDVEMRFCGVEFKLTPAQTGRMRDFLKRF